MTESHPTGLRMWWLGARPKTLPAAIVPVLVGTAAVADQRFVAWRFAAALVVALSLQVATNYANDYSDGIRGTDHERVGPLRLVGSGVASPTAVKRAIGLSFLVAAVAGLALAIAVTPWLLAVGAASMLAGWYYTGGSKPYGYLGLGELFVFVFFGLVATVGSAFVQVESFAGVAVALAVPVGLLATALLVVNNLRDRVGDLAAGKMTLAVRLGDRSTRMLYATMMGAAFATIAVVAVFDSAWIAIGLVGAVTAVPAIRTVRSGVIDRALIAALEATGRTQLLTGLGVSLGLLI